MTGETGIEISHGHLESRMSLTGRAVIESSPRFRAALVTGDPQNDQRYAGHRLVGAQLPRYVRGGDAPRGGTRRVRHRVRLRVIGLIGEPRMLAQTAELDVIFRAYGSDLELT